jgi:hypothetical protein
MGPDGPRLAAIVRQILRLASALIIALWPTTSAAQSTATGGRQFVESFFNFGIVDPLEPAAQILQNAATSADEIAKFVGIGITTLPIGTSSAGFSYIHDRQTGELILKSESFGPSFAERPLTNGSGVWNVGVNFQHSQTDYSESFGTADSVSDGIPIFDNTATFRSDSFTQFITRRAFLTSRINAFNVLATYGITDRFDIGVAVPIISLKLTGRWDDNYDISRTWNANLGNSRRDYATPKGTQIARAEESHSATGIGDVAIRLKYGFGEQRGDGAAVAGEIRLPTGDENELLGSGKASMKVMLVGSKTLASRASAFVNAGYTAGGASDEINYVGGVDVSLLARKQVTAAVTVLGRSLRDGALPVRVPTVRRTATNELGAQDIVVDRFFWQQQTLNLTQAAAGVKVHLGGRWLLSGTVLFPLNRKGFQSSWVPVIGIDRTWTSSRS